MSDKTAALFRSVIDEVLQRTQDDILIGYDGHVAASIVHDLQLLWEHNISQRQKESFATFSAAVTESPGQNDPSFQAPNTIKAEEAESLQCSATSDLPINPYEAPDSSMTLIPRVQPKIDTHKNPSIITRNKRGKTDTSNSPPPLKKRKTTKSPSDKTEGKTQADKRKRKKNKDDDDDKNNDMNDSGDNSSLSSSSDDDDDESAGDEIETTDIILCQFYQKLRHHKGRWRCPFRDGIMHLNGLDFVFHECSGDLRFY